jgi:hypothetical protein
MKNKKFAAVSAALACAIAAPTATALETYDLPADLLAFIASVPPTNDFAVGSGRFGKGQLAEGFNLSAHGSGLDAKGQVHFESAFLGGDFRGKVDCLVVSGDQAGLSGPLDEPPADNPTVTHFIIGVQDLGEPRGTPVDRAVISHATSPPMGALCGVGNLLGDEGAPITQGNIVVKDR